MKACKNYDYFLIEIPKMRYFLQVNYCTLEFLTFMLFLEKKLILQHHIVNEKMFSKLFIDYVYIGI